jgi:hypothetical protein
MGGATTGGAATGGVIGSQTPCGFRNSPRPQGRAVKQLRPSVLTKRRLQQLPSSIFT